MSKKRTGTDFGFDSPHSEMYDSRRARLPKPPATDAGSLRRKLKITQRQAARLLNVSKNTWIRWEKGQCKPDKLALELLPWLVKFGGPPTPCEDIESEPFDPGMLARHIQYCEQCRLAVKYVVIRGKL